MTPISGGCLCGQVRYAINSSPISQGICFCLQCQKTDGVFGSPLMVLHKDSFACSRQAVSFYKTQSDRGSIVSRHFCRECGSHIFSQISDVPVIITLKIATLDDLNHFMPQYAAWTRDASLAFTLPTGVPSFEKNAPIELVLGMK